MFALPGLILLVLTDYFKPQEYVPALAGLPLLHLFMALTLLGFVLDLRLGLSRLVASPQLVLTLLFVAWCAVTNVPNGAREAIQRAMWLLIPVSLYLLISHVVQTFRALQVLMAVVLAIGLSLAALAAHQAVAPWGCFKLSYGEGTTRPVYDGRSCSEDDKGICRRNDPDPGADYVCERRGLLGTLTAGGRVRFRGTMEDPNELALAVGVVVPLAFAFFDRRKSAARLALLVGGVALAGACAIFTQSRGGQLAFLAMLSVYLIRRLGTRGIVGGIACAVPVLLLGGRDTAEAAASVAERIECWWTGMSMFRASPLLGVGLGQFTEHHYLTAHNAYVLTAAELGAPGMVLWTSIIYVSTKIPLEAVRARPGSGLAPIARSWGLALLAALAGLLVGAMSLSYSYKEVLWIFVGLSGALYQAIHRHEPSFRVGFGPGDLALVVAVDVLLVAGISVYTSVKLAG